MEKTDRIMYLGKKLNLSNQVSYKYIGIDDENKTSRKWSFKQNLFKRGSVGSIYKCTFEKDSISYNTNEIPTSYIEEKGIFISTFIKFPFLEKDNEENRQVEIEIKNSKKIESPVDLEIQNLKNLYKDLSPQMRSAFIGNVIYKITN